MDDTEKACLVLFIVIVAVAFTTLFAYMIGTSLQTTATADTFQRELVRDNYTVMGTNWEHRPNNAIGLNSQTFISLIRQYNISTVYRYWDIFVIFIQQPQNQQAIPYYTSGN